MKIGLGINIYTLKHLSVNFILFLIIAKLNKIEEKNKFSPLKRVSMKYLTKSKNSTCNPYTVPLSDCYARKFMLYVISPLFSFNWLPTFHPYVVAILQLALRF